MAEQDPNVQGGGVQEPIPYVTAEMAWEMSKRAAAEAREEALKDALARTQSNTGAQNNMGNQNNMGSQNNMGNQNDRYDDYDDRRSRKRRRRDDDDEEEDLVGFSPKLVKQLQTTVGVFNTLKDFASNPMQKAIEDRIGGLAAGIIENAFTSPRGPPPKRDLVDSILNSQMAFGLGQGLGSRAPELVESLSRSFGKERAADIVDGMIGKYTGGGERRKIESTDRDRPQSPEPSRPSPVPQKSEDQSNVELLLSLDPNNAEHVAAYAESQGGISIDVARKMLMIHQDDIIKRMKSQGADTTVIEAQRGSRVGQDNPAQQNQAPQQQNASIHSVDVSSDYQTPPAQQVPPTVQQTYPNQQTHPVQQTFPGQQTHPIRQPSAPQPNGIQEDMQYMEPDIDDIQHDSQQPRQEYAEYKDVGQQEKNPVPESSNNQQAEMMKSFAEDIGKVMGDVIGKIENLNNTVFNLQNDLNEVKRQKSQPPTQPLGQMPLQEPMPSKDFFPDDFEKELNNTVSIQDSHPKDMGHVEESIQEDIRERPFAKGFFPEKAQNKHDFEKELEEETKRAIQLTKGMNINEPPNVDIIKPPNADINEPPNVDIIKPPNIDTKNKEIEIIKKPIMSMVNKKKINYSPRQKEENVQPENNANKSGEDKNDVDSKDNDKDKNMENKAE